MIFGTKEEWYTTMNDMFSFSPTTTNLISGNFGVKN